MMPQRPRIPYPGPSRLTRNTHRRRLGGVCSGLAEYMGWDVNLVRFLFLSSMLFGGLGFWLYLALWVALPAEEQTPFPKVSWTLGRALRKVEKKLARLHRRHDPRITDQAQAIFESIKLLAPELESPGVLATDAALRDLMLRGFPRLIDGMMALSPAQLVSALDHPASPARILVEQLWEQEARIQEAAQSVMESRFLVAMGQQTRESREARVWREHLRPLRQQLQERAGPETTRLLAGIEDKLDFLMQRLEGQPRDLLDLRPLEVEKIAEEYLPETLSEYLRLPALMARHEPIRGEKTAEDALHEQLQLLDATLHDLARSLFEKDAAGLLVHGRFLREKFGKPRGGGDGSPDIRL